MNLVVALVAVLFSFTSGKLISSLQKNLYSILLFSGLPLNEASEHREKRQIEVSQESEMPQSFCQLCFRLQEIPESSPRIESDLLRRIFDLCRSRELNCRRHSSMIGRVY